MLPQSLLPESFNTPIALAVVALLVALGVHYQRGLTPREYRAIMRVKTIAFPLLERVTAPDSRLSNALERSTIAPLRWVASTDFDSFVHEKADPDRSPEYITTSNLRFRDLWRRFADAGGSPHLLSSAKRRPDGSLSALHFVWFHSDGTQTEVYWFASDGAVYAHHETAVPNVEGHLSDGITPGDPRGVLDSVVLRL